MVNILTQIGFIFATIGLLFNYRYNILIVVITLELFYIGIVYYLVMLGLTGNYELYIIFLLSIITLSSSESSILLGLVMQILQ